MSTSTILLDQKFNANDVDIMVFEPCVLFRRRRLGGGLNTWSVKLEEVQKELTQPRLGNIVLRY